MLRFQPHPKHVWLSLLIPTTTAAIVLVILSALRTSGHPPSDFAGADLVLTAVIVWIPMVVTLLWTFGCLRREMDHAREASAGSAAADASLREAMERTRLILDSTLDAVVGMDAQGSITDWNARAEAMFGWTRKEAIGRKLDETIIPPQYRDAHERGLQRFLANGEGPFLNRRIELTALRRDGTEFPIELAISPLKMGESYVFSAFIADVTERKQAEEALRDSQERFRKAFSEAPIGMALCATDGRWLQVNRALCQIVGYAEHELLATNFQSITHPDDLQADLALARQLLNGEIQSYQMEKRYIHKLGHVAWIQLTGSIMRDLKGAPLYYIAQIQDITERKKAEVVRERLVADLAESRTRFEMFFRQTPSPIAITTIKEGRFLDLNKQAEVLTGYSREELIGRTTVEMNLYVDPTDRPKLVQALREKGVLTDLERLIRTKSGEIRTAIFSLVPIQIGSEPCLLSIAHDITERRRAEEALRSNEQVLRTLIKEREQLAQDLHDGIIQSLYAIGMSIDECRRLTDEDPLKAGMKLGQTVDDINRVIREVRHHLAQSDDDMPFSANRFKTELTRVAGTMERANALHFRLKVDPRAAECLTTEERKELLYIAQETMSNCLRHSGASIANVSLRLGRDRVVLEVEDDGRGFETATLIEANGGLNNIDRRAVKVGAKVEIVSRRDHGTRIRVIVPIHN